MKPYYEHAGITIIHGDCREILPMLPAESVQCCVTSPPYFGLRDYGGDAQIGLEETPAAFVAVMVEVFDLVRQTLRSDGTLWLNLGDSYCSDNKWGGLSGRKNAHSLAGGYDRTKRQTGFKPKDLFMIPARVAIALQDDGWWVRSDIVWHKSNAMPEPVTDRPTRAHEYIYLLSKSARYHYDADAIREPLAEKTFTTFGTRHRPQGNDALGMVKSDNWGRTVETRKPKMIAKQDGHGRRHVGFNQRWEEAKDEGLVIAGANKRDVWSVATAGYPDAHFATFPEKLVEPCILAGCPTGGIVLDPFGGSGTTARVAKRLGRRAILIEQNEAYCEMAARSLCQDVLPLEVPA